MRGGEYVEQSEAVEQQISATFAGLYFVPYPLRKQRVFQVVGYAVVQAADLTDALEKEKHSEPKHRILAA